LHGTQGVAAISALLAVLCLSTEQKGEDVFLHRVKMNWKKYQKPTAAILLFALARIVLEKCFGEAPLSCFAVFKLALISLAATVAWAFLKTCWELGAVYYRRLCTFKVALRKFCRDYWGKAAAV
jgi:hypothetical protein